MPRSTPDPAKAAADRATLTAAIRERNATRLRPVDVREPTEEDSPNSGGVVVEFTLNESMSTSTSVDMNRREATALLDKLAAFLYDDVELGDEVYAVAYGDDPEGEPPRVVVTEGRARHLASAEHGDRILKARQGYRIPRGPWEVVE